MAEQIDHRLIYEILKSVQGRLALLEGMCAEMGNMRAFLRTPDLVMARWSWRTAWPSWSGRWSALSVAWRTNAGDRQSPAVRSAHYASEAMISR
jgi:hypothetical protein